MAEDGSESNSENIWYIWRRFSVLNAGLFILSEHSVRTADLRKFAKKLLKLGNMIINH